MSSIDEFGYELEKNFHDQFSENHNEQNKFLIHLLTIAGAAISGYGYVLFGLTKSQYEIIDAYGILCLAVGILLSCLKLIYDMGFSYRRDQIVLYRIRRKYKIISESAEDDINVLKSFPYYFNPLKKFKHEKGKLITKKRFEYFWMPALHNSISFIINFCIILLFIFFWLKTKQNVLIIILMLMCTLICSFIIHKRKHDWLKVLFISEFNSNENAIKK